MWRENRSSKSDKLAQEGGFFVGINRDLISLSCDLGGKGGEGRDSKKTSALRGKTKEGGCNCVGSQDAQSQLGAKIAVGGEGKGRRKERKREHRPIRASSSGKKLHPAIKIS